MTELITALDIFITVIAGILAASLIYIAFRLFPRKQGPPPRKAKGIIGKGLGETPQARHSDRR